MLKLEANFFKERFFIRLDYSYYLLNSFFLGVNFSSRDLVYSIHNGDEDNEPIIEQFRENSFNICLGLISFHIGFRTIPEETSNE